MSKSLFQILIFVLFTNISFGQYPEQPNKELLKKYSSYIHQIEPKSCWKYKYKLKKGLIVLQENYCNSNLTYRTEFKYNVFDNVIREIQTYDVNEGKVSDSTNFKLIYENLRLIEKGTDNSSVEKYSNFNKSGKPKLIERKDDFGIFPYKEILEYDPNGNILKSIEFSTNLDLKTENEYIQKEITQYEYDKYNNVIEIHRDFEPKQEFPIPIIGGPFLYEHEYYRYKYNKKGLWRKKFKTVNGKEYLIAKRKFK